MQAVMRGYMQHKGMPPPRLDGFATRAKCVTVWFAATLDGICSGIVMRNMHFSQLQSFLLYSLVIIIMVDAHNPSSYTEPAPMSLPFAMMFNSALLLFPDDNCRRKGTGIRRVKNNEH